jgi:pSer/pThr/pTyr-binding forkhead associated (FHA) protein
MTPRLIVVSGPLYGWIIYLDEPVISLGRHCSNDIITGDLCISRWHCLISREAEQYRIIDLGSMNGTFVNGKQVKDHFLRECDFIQIGSCCLIFWLNDIEEFLALRSNKNRLESQYRIQGQFETWQSETVLATAELN